MNELLRVGSRVRLRRPMLPGVRQPDVDGEVERIDARGVLVRLDSGRAVLCEPDILAVLSSDAPP